MKFFDQNSKSVTQNYNLFIVICLSFLTFVRCNNHDTDAISFVDKEIVIDGKLDKQLMNLPIREFNHVFQFDNPKTDTIPVTYRMAYTTEHLYVYIEAKTDSVNYRPKGFVNGDGFKLLLAKHQKDSLTSEYYDLAFSPSKDKSYWARTKIWDYNHVQRHGKNFSDKTQLQVSSNNGIVGYEAQIAWEDIEPYHPFFEDSLGYNLYFAKAIGDTITNGYATVKDKGIWHEEFPTRYYKQVDFELPNSIDNDIFLTRIKRRNIKEGNNITIELVALSKDNKKLAPEIQITSGGDLIKSTTFDINTSKSFQRIEKKLITNDLGPGEYEVTINLESKHIKTAGFQVLPDIDLKQIKSQITENQYGVNTGAQETLLYKIEKYERLLGDLKPYESNPKILEIFSEGTEEYGLFMNGVDPYIDKKGPYQRAFLSGQDNTLQPYSIKLPENYNPDKKYPLLVFLHGSGATDEGLLNFPRSGGEFIEIAPYGRDMFFTYASKKSQNDILEAIEDVSKYYNVDKSKIVIGGFSMGGYGSLRTFYENPSLYKGVVIHAGHPNLANNWLDGSYPNFLDENYLKPFKDTRVFIYHGKKDGSLPVSKIEKMIEKMKTLEIDVTSIILEDKGHEFPDDRTNASYFNWLVETIK